MKKVYPKYRETNIPWLPIMPDHWDEKPLKHSLTINACTLSESTLPTFTFLYIDIESVVEGKVSPELQKMSFSNAPSRARRIVKKGDVVLSTVRTYLKATAQIPYSDTPIIVSTGFATFHESTKIDKDFLKFLVRQDSFINEIVALSTGVSYPAISPSRLGNIKIPLPPLPEQHQIAAFLDHKCALIDTFIQKKTRLIELLREQKQAIINRAVTRGIDPNVRLKPSGIEWLGDIPEHWEVKKLKYILKEISKRSEDGIGTLLMVSQEYGVVERSKYHEKIEVAQTTIGHKICEKGDLVFNKLKAHLGVFFKTNYDGLVSPDYAIYRGKGKIDVTYFEYLFRHPAYIYQFTTRTTGIVEGLMRLYTSELFSIKVPLPPAKEIDEILNFTRIESANIERIITRIQHEIDLIQEYKTTLIAEAVTGKIDVRNWKPKEHSLPIETKKAATL